MVNRADENRRHFTRFHTSKKPFYTLFIFIIIFLSSLSLPFRFHSLGFKFTNYLDTNDRHYIFLLCNGILLLILLDSGSNQARAKARKIGYSEISVSSVDDSNDSLYTHDQVEDLETESAVHVHNELELEVVVKGIDRIEESDTKLVLGVEDKDRVVAKVEVEEEDQEEDANEFHPKCDEFINETGMLVAIEDSETKLVLDVEDKVVAKAEVEEEEHDDQEDPEFRHKCEEFIRKVRQSMHHEGPLPLI